jgi:UDP-N-acetylglucosamine 3-dehydrogenase
MRHLSVGHAEPLRAELAAFVKAVREGMPPPVTGEDGVASLAVAIECLNGRADAAAKSTPYIKAVPGQRRARAAFAEP